MKFSYKFSNLIGTIYRNGNLVFTSDGNSIISPIGNRLKIYDLKNNKSQTLSLESRYSYNTISLSPDDNILIAVNEEGDAQLISMVSCAVIHRHKFQNKVQHVQFSKDGTRFAVSNHNMIFVFRSPSEITGEYKPFLLERSFIGGYDDITCMDWSTDSRFLAIGCRDNSTKIIALQHLRNFRTYTLSGHTDSIVGCYFEYNSLHLTTISRNGQLCIWECSIDPINITEIKYTEVDNRVNQQKKKRKILINNEESEDDVLSAGEEKEYNRRGNSNVDDNETENDERKMHPFYYRKLTRHYLANEARKENFDAILTAADYNNRIRILVIAFSTGSFYLYELPEVNMIHSLNISNYPISTAVFNSTGDWVALASKDCGQLLVWEWQSEQYILKQQGDNSEITCISYSPDGQYIATGSDFCKVKLWNIETGFCFVTFNEHTSGVTDMQFSRNKKFLISSSLDGTVRAFDIKRYRNFRVFTSPQLVQFACVAVDYSSEFVVAGGQNVFDIYLWSIKLGKLLEIISGHRGPVSSVAFSPVPTSSILVSGSWDKTIKLWSCLQRSSQNETIDLLSDVVQVTFHPSGDHIAAATLGSKIVVFDVKTAIQVCSIDGRNDLGSGRSDTDIVTAKINLQGKYFTSIEYSADGECILAGGKSHVICIYHAREAILLKKFEITQNHSFDAMNEYINRRYVTDFGNMLLVEQRENLEGGKIKIQLPGVRKGDAAARRLKPEINVFSLRFSPTGQAFAVSCTEGLCIYSLDKGVIFDPFDLSMEVTPRALKNALNEKEHSKSLIMSLKLNDFDLASLALESVPFQDIQLVCSTLPNEYANRLPQIIAHLLQTTPHLEFYLQWCCCLLASHGNKDEVLQHYSLLALHESMSRKYEMIHKICDFNKYTLKVLLNTKTQQSLLKCTNESGDDSDSEMLLITRK